MGATGHINTQIQLALNQTSNNKNTQLNQHDTQQKKECLGALKH